MVAVADLHAFITLLEGEGELRRVTAEVDPHLEITEIADRCVKSGGPALLFERVRGAGLPVAINLFASDRRMALALGVEDLGQVAERIRSLLGLVKRRPGGVWGALGLLPELRPLLSMSPRRLTGRAPVQEVVWRGGDVDLRRLPVLTCWPGDAGPFITLPQVITADPDTGQRNVGVYRMQVHGPRALGLHWERHKGGAAHYRVARETGRAIPVAAAIGGDPASVYAAGAPLPEGLDEYVFAGFLRGAPVELCRAVSVPLDVPARAEIIIEGFVAADELVREGPFGDHTGFYDAGGPYPVMRVTAVTMRRDPVYLTTVVGRPPSEEHWLLGRTSERLFLPLLQAVFPEIADVHVPAEGVANNLVFVALHKRYPGQAYKVAYGLWAVGLLALSKVVVVVDDWVPVQQPAAAWWAALANCDPGRDVLIARGPGSVLDHALAAFSFGGKMVIDGTRKWPEEAGARAAAWPEPIFMEPAVVEAVTRRWETYGIGPDPGRTAPWAPSAPVGAGGRATPWSGAPEVGVPAGPGWTAAAETATEVTAPGESGAPAGPADLGAGVEDGRGPDGRPNVGSEGGDGRRGR